MSAEVVVVRYAPPWEGGEVVGVATTQGVAESLAREHADLIIRGMPLDDYTYEAHELVDEVREAR